MSADPRATPEALEAFRVKLRAGDTAGAFATVKRMTPECVSMLMLEAGFSVQDHRGRNVKDFWAHVQSNIVKACRERKDGYELRGEAELFPA
ncbi:hypothetical protein [Paraburkholderia sp. GAS32]|uniref:hypothetical protein n=1 Tax=Paraburkholderia sp. GAS32 TaxID=3035129 RepID=UPI003D1A7FE7